MSKIKTNWRLWAAKQGKALAWLSQGELTCQRDDWHTVITETQSKPSDFELDYGASAELRCASLHYVLHRDTVGQQGTHIIGE